MTTHYLHDLRPSFTNNLINLLRKNTSINLIAPAGYGRKRLLEDIKNSRFLINSKIVLVDMKDYTTNYDELMQVFCRQLKFRGKKPIEFDELITQLEKKPNRAFFYYTILMHCLIIHSVMKNLMLIFSIN